MIEIQILDSRIKKMNDNNKSYNLKASTAMYMIVRKTLKKKNSFSDKLRMMKLLIKLGSDVNAKSSNQSPLHKSANKSNCNNVVFSVLTMLIPLYCQSRIALKLMKTHM